MIERRSLLAGVGALASAIAGAARAEPAAAARGVAGGKAPALRSTPTIEPSRTMRAARFDWSYQVDVALPPSYFARPDARYPVLWVTDGPQLFHLAVGLAAGGAMGGLAPELIIVGVGCPGEEGLAEWQRRRGVDFTPPGADFYWDGPGSDFFKRLGGGPSLPGQANDFLAFLIDSARPALAAQYRMDDDHGLFGHSGGGMFATYALFARPGGFRRYIIGSPSINAVDRSAFRLEKAYAETHKDLPAKVFFGAGEKEIGQTPLAAWGIVSSETLMAETLLLRQYRSLELKTRIFPGKDHFTVIPDIISEGIQSVWADKTQGLPRPFG